ncbi:hypothetical protein D3C87_1822690 [compost metagenome]
MPDLASELFQASSNQLRHRDLREPATLQRSTQPLLIVKVLLAILRNKEGRVCKVEKERGHLR